MYCVEREKTPDQVGREPEHALLPESQTMLTPLILLIAFGLLALVWSEARAAADQARVHGREACASAGVQWLDQNVMLTRIGLRRASDGRLRILRHYRFDYSLHGDDRHQGSLALLGRELQWISAPSAPVPPPQQMH